MIMIINAQFVKKGPSTRTCCRNCTSNCSFPGSFPAVQNEKTYSTILKTVTATEKHDTQMPGKQELPDFISTLQQEVQVSWIFFFLNPSTELLFLSEGKPVFSKIAKNLAHPSTNTELILSLVLLLRPKLSYQHDFRQIT